MREITQLIVHCSATKASMDIGVDEIDRWHQERGWLGIGYHFVIRRDGTIENGRMIDQQGAHAKGFNRNSLGICLVGGLNDKNRPEHNFTVQQMASLDKLMKELYDHYPIRLIAGHRDLPNVNKACPCFDVTEFREEIGLFGNLTYEDYKDETKPKD